MKKQAFYLLIFICFFLTSHVFPQDSKPQKVSKLFKKQEILPIKLNYSNRDVKRNTNDSTYIKTNLTYKDSDASWQTIPVEIRERGNYRRKNCYFSPMKMKLLKSNSKETLFKGNKKLKLVLPCLKQKGANDNVVKEWMAYKLYEIISPYHFKTRLVAIDLEEIRGKKTTNHTLKGILIEDDKKVAKRHKGSVLKRPMHPLNQDPLTSVQNAFFQFMIANTDYSTAYQHNEKLFFINKRILPVPYDFDMCGLVNASYAVVSKVQNETLPIEKVTQRMYRGFKRDQELLQQVRGEFLNKKTELLEIVNNFEPHFEDPDQFSKSKKFISSFFEIMSDDKKFRKDIISKVRTK